MQGFFVFDEIIKTNGTDFARHSFGKARLAKKNK